MYHMTKATVRDLRYRFPEIEARLRDGEEIVITKRKRVVARLLPPKRSRPGKKRPPDFRKMLRKIYGDKVLKVSGAELIAQERDRY